MLNGQRKDPAPKKLGIKLAKYHIIVTVVIPLVIEAGAK